MRDSFQKEETSQNINSGSNFASLSREAHKELKDSQWETPLS